MHSNGSETIRNNGWIKNVFLVRSCHFLSQEGGMNHKPWIEPMKFSVTSEVVWKGTHSASGSTAKYIHKEVAQRIFPQGKETIIKRVKRHSRIRKALSAQIVLFITKCIRDTNLRSTDLKSSQEIIL